MLIGKRGPQPTPTAILEKRGSWRAKTRNSEPVGVSFNCGCPEWIDDENAINKWKELSTLLTNLGVLQSTDNDTLARYCFWWGKFVAQTKTCHDLSDLNKIESNLKDLGARLGLSPTDRTKISIPEKPTDKKDKFLRAV